MFIKTLCVLIFYSVFYMKHPYAQVYNVLAFGAKGDGKTSDTNAVRSALAAAVKTNGGRVVFDHGYTFYTGAFNVTDNVILDVQGTILASINPDEYPIIHDTTPWWPPGAGKSPFIQSIKANNITITGGGIIDGNGPYWYACMCTDGGYWNHTYGPCGRGETSLIGRPTMIQPTYTNNLVVENITLKDSPLWNLHLAYCTNVLVNNFRIISPSGPPGQEYSLNTDGIDVDASVNVTIKNGYIHTADDAITIKSGQGPRSMVYGRPSENVLVQNLTVGFSNGLAVGANLGAGAKNITFRDISVSDSFHGILLKTMVGNGGGIENIIYDNIRLHNVTIAIEVNLHYSNPQPDGEIPSIKNLVINNVTAENVYNVWNIQGLTNCSCLTNLYLNNIYVTGISGPVHRNCYGEVYGTCHNSTVVPYCPQCLKQEQTCFDASSDCTAYLTLCNSDAYRPFMCDQCRKSCNLCNSC